ncbi:Na-translocating system protein MpsC family protein [Alicyclobacillus acidoterrestris]|uniref:Na-translocating system protein MpsC family protein n=1 Tax=Alicyclobacillus acidoterrestris TaxID=1450 RepID=UPI003F53718F
MNSPFGARSGQHPNQQIANYIGKLLRDTFGKGPETVQVATGFTFFTVYLRNFMSPMEKVLMENDQEETVYELRLNLVRSLFPEIRTYVEMVTGVKLREFYCDWGFHNQSGMLVGISEDPFPNSESFREIYEGKEQVEREIVRISQEIQKPPEEIYSCMLNPRTLLIVRNGLLVRIEKEFLRLGQAPLLRRVKARLEKTYLHNSEYFQEYLNQRVMDSFVDWDFERDKSVIVMMLNQKPLPGKGERLLGD